MMRTLFAAASAAALLAACSQPATAPDKTPEAAPDAASAPSAHDTPRTPSSATALGLTATQLEKADLVSVSGADLGDIERVDVNGAGMITGLIVAPDGAGQGWVRLPLDGLTVKADGEDHEVVANLTLEQLRAMPAWAP